MPTESPPCYDIKWIRENPEAFDRALTRRGLEPLSAKLIALDETRRAAIPKLEEAQARRNAASKEIGEAKAKGRGERAALMAEVATLKTRCRSWKRSEGADKALDKALADIPNVPLDEVPVGEDESGNVEHHRSARSATMRSSPSSISSWARRSA